TNELLVARVTSTPYTPRINAGSKKFVHQPPGGEGERPWGRGWRCRDSSAARAVTQQHRAVARDHQVQGGRARGHAARRVGLLADPTGRDRPAAPELGDLAARRGGQSHVLAVQ